MTKRSNPKPKRDRDPFDHPDFKRYAKHFFDEVAPKIRDSAYMISVAPVQSAADVKIATELDYSLLLDKPLIVFVPSGRREHIAAKLLRVADHVIEGDAESESGRAEMQRKLTAILNQ